MNVTVNIILGYSFNDTACALDVDVIESEVPFSMLSEVPSKIPTDSLRLVVASDQVVNHVGMPHALFNGLGVTQIHFLEEY